MISDATLLDWMKADAGETATLRLLEKAAIKAVEAQTGRYYGVTATKTEIIRFRGWPLPLGSEPVSFTSLSQWDGSAWSVVASTNYYLDGSYIWPNATYTWPTSYLNPPQTPRFKAIYTAGYTVDIVDANVWPAPDDIQMAVKLLVGHWFEHRESVVIGQTAVELPQSVQMLLSSHARVSV